MSKYCISRSEIIEEIKIKRELMIKSAYKHGFTSESTIRFSQELDELINEFQKKNGASSRVNEEGSFPLNQMMLIWPKVLVKL